MVSSRPTYSHRRIAPGAALRRPTPPPSSQPSVPESTRRHLPIGQAPGERSSTRADPDQHGRLPIGALRAQGPPVAGREGSRRRQAPSPSTTPPERRRRLLTGVVSSTVPPSSLRVPTAMPQPQRPSGRTTGGSRRTTSPTARSSSDGTQSSSSSQPRHSSSPRAPLRRPPLLAPTPQSRLAARPTWPRTRTRTNPAVFTAPSRSPAPRSSRPAPAPAGSKHRSGQPRAPSPAQGSPARSALSSSESSESLTPASPSRSPAPPEVDLGANVPPAPVGARPPRAPVPGWSQPHPASPPPPSTDGTTRWSASHSPSPCQRVLLSLSACRTPSDAPSRSGGLICR